MLELIALADERKLYAERGYPSLFHWLTQKYGYSESAANRRIGAAWLERSVPETLERIESGDLNLTTVAKAHGVFRAQEKVSKGKLSRDVKTRTIERIANKSAFKAEQIHFSLFPEVASSIKQERVVILNQNTTRLSANISNDVRERFEKVRDLLSHKLPGAGFIEIADYFFQMYLKDATAVAAKQRVKDDNKTLTPKTRRIVLQKFHHRCSYQDPVTGKICGSAYMLQIDHRIPRSLGGSNGKGNLRVLCGVHNRLMAERILGNEIANCWRSDGVLRRN